VKKKLLPVLTLLLVFLITTVVLAEDGDLFRRNISKTPDLVTEKAAIYMMDFYVPAQASTGEVKPVDNYCLDDGLSGGPQPEGCTAGYEAGYGPRDYAKPLVSVYIDGPEGLNLEPLAPQPAAPVGVDEVTGGIIFGAMDAYVGVSLDDGTSWRTENLSRSADLSSYTLANGHPFPGHVHQLVHQVAEDKILVAWASKYCDSGNPLYTFSSDTNLGPYGSYLESLETTYGKDALYLYDFFGVAGPQASVDYTKQGFPEVGEIPYSCIWTARGKLVAGDDPLTADFVEASHVIWTKPERLTAGVRDANLPAVDCAKGAGCFLTWQEDPLGLRPGQGLGPGEGWSGAIANGKTDIWSSYISFADFDLVFPEGTDYTTLPADGPVTIEANELAGSTTMPKAYVPMAMPTRLTDNDMCKAVAGTNNNPEDPFCWMNFDNIGTINHTTIAGYLDLLDTPEEDANYCATSVPWTNPGGTTHQICVTRDGRPMIGRVGATRVRMVIKPYTKADGTTSAWLSMAAEETKAMGDQMVDALGIPTDDPLDMGKDIWYYSFDMFEPPIVDQGGILNQPSVCNPYLVGAVTYDCDAIADEHGFLPLQTATIDTKDSSGTVTGSYVVGDFYLTDIARRFALTLNNIPNIGATGLSGMLIYKQGGIWQGGPADIMLRRLVVPDGFDPTVDNPFAFDNMACDEWAYTDGTNPNYVKGICLSPAINISGTTIKRCTTLTGGEVTDNDTCADEFPVAEDGSIPGTITFDKFPKVLEWRQLPYSAGDTFADPNDMTDLDDQWWDNPFDVAKGHRGFLDGDFVMMMYAWSPNWNSNAVGNDHYNLYVRRSFDGGVTWTTTPAGLDGAGIDVLEYQYGDNAGDFVPIVFSYGAGAAEQARNVSLLHGNKITILDPRYSPTGGLKQYPTIRTDWVTNADNSALFPADFAGDPSGLPYEDDAVRDPSKFMMIYETGDNTTVAVGEAIPLNLYYSRATVYGDVWEWYDYVNDPLDGDPENGFLDPMTVDIEPRFPWLENNADDLSGEASVVMNVGGTFSYVVWNQWREEILPDGHELLYDSDIIFRRLMYVPDGATTTLLLRPLASVLYLSSPTITAGLDDDILDGVFTGIVKSIGDKFWTIGNYSVRVTKDTEIKETIVVGDYVKVKFVWDSTTMVATEIELEDDDDLIIVGTGRIRNHAHQGNQIEAYRWRSQSGNVCAMDLVDDDGDGLVECEQILQLKAHQFATNRWHIFTLDVLDSAGNWSAPVSVSIYVSDGNFYLMLPVMSRN
jgi:hypothetical protein